MGRRHLAWCVALSAGDIIVTLGRGCDNVGECGAAPEDLTAFPAGTSRNFDETTARIFDRGREVAGGMGRNEAATRSRAGVRFSRRAGVAGAVRAGFGFGRVAPRQNPQRGGPDMVRPNVRLRARVSERR